MRGTGFNSAALEATLIVKLNGFVINNWMQSQYYKRVLLALIAAALLSSILLWRDTGPSPHVLAQTSPLTPEFTATPGLTPSPTPTPVKRTNNIITEPKSTDAIFGYTSIIGTALVDGFQRYDVHVSAAGVEDWQWLHTSYRPVYEDTLHVFDTTAYGDGYYDLRVRAIAMDGSYTESFVRGVEIRNWNPPTLTPNPEVTPAPLSPLPTPTPAVLSRIPGGQGFYGPDSGAILDGLVDIRATVNGTRERRFSRYELALSEAGLEQWEWLYGDDTQVWQNGIYRLDTSAYPDGRYDMRLRIVYEDGNYSEYYLRGLTFANAGGAKLDFTLPAGIVRPRSGATESGIVDIVGTVPAEELLRWELSWSASGRESWSYLVGGEEPVLNQTIARLDLSQLPKGQYDIRLRVVRSDYNYSDYYVRDLQLQR